MYKKKLHNAIITLLAFTCLNVNSFANETQLKADHPHRHVVAHDDALSNISSKCLKDPWWWSKLGTINRDHITNPHLIYPGDVVILELSPDNPWLRLLHETAKLEPTARIEALDKKAIARISPPTITPLLPQALLIENDELATAPRIIAGPDSRIIMNSDTRIYINGIDEEGGPNCNIYNPGKALVNTATEERLGTEAIHFGDLNVVRFSEPVSADMRAAKEEIFVEGRLVMAAGEIQNRFVILTPEAQLKGRIIPIDSGVTEAVPNAVVAINLGEQDALKVGHVLAISRYGRMINDPEYKPTDVVKENPTLKELTFVPGQVMLADELTGLFMRSRTFDRVS